MLVKLVKNKKFHDTVSSALVEAYKEKKAVLVTQKDNFVCALLPQDEEGTIEITEHTIGFVGYEFVDFDNPHLYNWEDCNFEVINIDDIKIEIRRN